MIPKVSESEIDDYFSHERSPYPMSLCRYYDGAMRTAIKEKLKNFLLKDVSPSNPLSGTFRTISDRCAFLWCCKYKKNDLFSDMFQKYDARKFGIDIVVFDGNTNSTKDCTHLKRIGKMLGIVDICDDNTYLAKRGLFLASVILTKRNLFENWLKK